MRINLGVPAYLVDGEKGPPIDRVIVEPRLWEITHVVVRKGKGLAQPKLVPISLVNNWANDRIMLRLTRDELADMPDYIERHYVTPREMLGSAREAGGGNLPSTELLTQEGIPYGPGFLPHQSAPVEGHVTKPQEPASGPIELRQGAQVEAADGHVGTLGQLLLDTYVNRITTLVLGGVDKGVKERRVPVEWVAYLGPGLIRLAASKQQVEQIVGPPAGNYLPETGKE